MSTKSMQKTVEYERIMVQDNFEYFKSNNTKKQRTFAKDIKLSLDRESRFIDPKYFYDDYGSQLFDRICTLPEYLSLIHI